MCSNNWVSPSKLATTDRAEELAATNAASATATSTATPTAPKIGLAEDRKLVGEPFLNRSRRLRRLDHSLRTRLGLPPAVRDVDRASVRAGTLA